MGFIKGHKMSEEHKRKLIKIHTGKTVSEETRKRMRGAQEGHKTSEEARKKMSESHKRLFADQQKLGLKNHNWKEKFKHGEYVGIHFPGYHRADSRGRVLEHIVIWETIYNRKVPEGYVVHHLNGIKNDNRPENLCIISKKDHMKINEPYKKRIRELEIEIVRLKQLDLFDD